MGKDSIPGLTKINYEDIDDENRSYYYLKDQVLFDSLRLGFYKDKLYRYDGFIFSREKAGELYTYLCNNFRGKKSDDTKYFRGGNKNYYINLTPDFSDSSFSFSFIERNIHDAFIFHCFSPRRIYFWKGPYYYYHIERRLQDKKRKKMAKLLDFEYEY